METSAPDPDCVRGQLDRLLASHTLSGAHSLKRFLSYVVDRSLDGDGDALKEYAIGVEVFGRGDAFDPRTDTIVRVQARRLRSKLAEYYEAEGALDLVVVEIPKGSYVARFHAIAFSDLHGRPRIARDSAGTPYHAQGRQLDKLRGLLGRDARLATLTSAAGDVRLALQLALDGFQSDDRAWALRMARGFLAYWDWCEQRGRQRPADLGASGLAESAHTSAAAGSQRSID
jgi:hypothetical protein